MVYPFEKDAEQGNPMPDGLSLPDQLAYQFLVNLYDRLRKGIITREQAAEEKGKMTYQHSVSNNILKSYQTMGTYWAGMRKALEASQIAYQKDRTLENADRLSAVLDGRLTECSPAGPVQNT